MIVLYVITILALLVSLIFNIQKTRAALKIAGRRFRKILPDLLLMIILVSLAFYLIPDRAISRYLGQDNRLLAASLAILFGSITLMPGFIVFPLCGLLLQKGVPYFVLAAFTTTLMMVGVVTFPLERVYFGTRITFLRNGISLIIAIFVAMAIGLIYGELVP